MTKIGSGSTLQAPEVTKIGTSRITPGIGTVDRPRIEEPPGQTGDENRWLEQPCRSLGGPPVEGGAALGVSPVTEIGSSRSPPGLSGSVGRDRGALRVSKGRTVEQKDPTWFLLPQPAGIERDTWPILAGQERASAAATRVAAALGRPGGGAGESGLSRCPHSTGGSGASGPGSFGSTTGAGSGASGAGAPGVGVVGDDG